MTITIEKVPLSYKPKDIQPNFPYEPVLYLELLENKDKVKQEYKNVNFKPENFPAIMDKIQMSQEKYGDLQTIVENKNSNSNSNSNSDSNSNSNANDTPKIEVIESPKKKSKKSNKNESSNKHTEQNINIDIDKDIQFLLDDLKISETDEDVFKEIDKLSAKVKKSNKNETDKYKNDNKENKNDKKDKYESKYKDKDKDKYESKYKDKKKENEHHESKDKYESKYKDKEVKKSESPKVSEKVNLPPTLSDINNNVKVGDNIYEDITHKETPIELEEKRQQLLFKFDILRKSYNPDLIPKFSNSSDIATMDRSYNNLVKKLYLESTVDDYKKWLTMAFIGIEKVLGGVLKFDMTDYSNIQVSNMNSYERILIEMGEKSVLKDKHKMAPEFRLGLMILVNTVFFILAKTLGDSMMKNAGLNVKKNEGVKKPIISPPNLADLDKY